MSRIETIRVMIIEDEADLRDTLCRYLEAVGMSVTGQASGANLGLRMHQEAPHVVILDVNLPGESGFTIAARLRATSGVGIVFMTARSPKEDRVLGLSIGADHYMVKPVEPAELELVVRNLHRRLMSGAAPIMVAWTFNMRLWTITAPDGPSITVSKAEFALLAALMGAPGVPFTREMLRSLLNSSDHSQNGRSVDTVIYRLKKRVFIEIETNIPIQAVRSIGYVFAGEAKIIPE